MKRISDKLAVQMYTLREQTKTLADFTTSLHKIREIGYSAIQLSKVGCMEGEAPEVSARAARRLLDDHDLKCVATHRPWDALTGRTEEEIEFHKTLECSYVAIGGLPKTYDRNSYEAYARFIQDAMPVIQKLKEEGIAFGFHNHAHEWLPCGPNRTTPFDLMVEKGGDDFTLELDVYWAQHAGLNPVRVLERCRGRVPVVHLKDKEVTVDHGPYFAPVGEGNLDWKNILSACVKAGVEWYAVEQDECLRDPFDCLRSSYEFLTAKDL